MREIDDIIDTLLTCSVCMNIMTSDDNSIKSLCVIPCGHRFCSNCILKWISNAKNSCPQCRVNISDLMHDSLLSEVSNNLVSLSSKIINLMNLILQRG